MSMNNSKKGFFLVTVILWLGIIFVPFFIDSIRIKRIIQGILLLALLVVIIRGIIYLRARHQNINILQLLGILAFGVILYLIANYFK